MASEPVVQAPAPVPLPPTEQLDFAFESGPLDQAAVTARNKDSQALPTRSAKAARYRAATGR